MFLSKFVLGLLLVAHSALLIGSPAIISVNFNDFHDSPRIIVIK